MDVTFTNSLNYHLAGKIELPKIGQPPFPVVIFAHGFDSSKDSPRGKVIAALARDKGLATFLFDFTGHADSEGSKEESTLNQQIDDLKCALNFAQTVSNLDKNLIGVTGASSGGLVAGSLALMDKRIKALVLRAPRTDGLIKEAARISVPTRIIQGELDPLLLETTRFFQALQCEKDLIVIPGGDHLFSQPQQLKQVANLTVDWFTSHLLKKERKAA